MREEDSVVLECLEDVHYALAEALKRIGKVRTVHVAMLENNLADLRSLRRTIEEVSAPARLIVEHLLEAWLNGWLVALETESLRLGYVRVRSVKVEPFGNICVSLGDLDITWRDESVSYYFYPDKVELRAADEKSGIKFFFALAFAMQNVRRFPDLPGSLQVAYIHPQMEQWIKKVL
ncbi:Hypothetical protein DEACI_1895 [Acididesulfobacillus acetoxydans]|uniref:Uncharacterized protein n=1 Tax=Acididesulfobacillus acetoxydans TaxID=1561005 RepID=A0A8S0WY20_9FIRM|nr:hypothetical protein [Acididesulfobacillus acetoxydans]CAA7601241.1 Hypothetical protein DEACI_1895 [Acididesulfobacillus acetoxydans]CEJ08480.1 Hypothetical protein DEACI_2957 [Acididesulfobacillus acetoxydans]